MTLRNLILSGGIYHPFEETSAIIAGQLASLGLQSDILSVRAGLARLGTGHFDLLTVNALAFTMTQHEKYEPLRATHAFAINEAEKAAIRGHMAAGGKLLGLHTAAICFDDWPEWRDHLGAGWRWGMSHHPPPCSVLVSAEPPFKTVDELYYNLSLAPRARVAVTGTCADEPDPQPILVHHGNAAFLALGHDVEACLHPGFTQLLTRAVHSLIDPEKRTA